MMKNFTVFTLNGSREEYAIKLPVNGINDPNIGDVIRLFEMLVDWAGLRNYHKNPEDGLNDQQQLEIMQDNFFYNDDMKLFAATLSMPISDASYRQLLRFAEIAEKTYQDNNLL